MCACVCVCERERERENEREREHEYKCNLILESNLHDQKRTRGDSHTTEYLKARQASIYTMKKERNEDRQTINKLQC